MESSLNEFDWQFLIWTIAIALILAFTQWKLDFNWLKRLFEKIWVAITVFAIGLALFFYRSSSFIVEDTLGSSANFGQFGDFIGGLLNPILGFISVIILVKTIKLSRMELERRISQEESEVIKKSLTSEEKEFAELVDSSITFPSGNSVKLNELEIFTSKFFREESEFVEEVILDKITSAELIDPTIRSARAQVLEARNKFDYIETIYKELMKIEPRTYEREALYQQFDVFANKAWKIRLLNDQELSSKRQELIDLKKARARAEIAKMKLL